MQVGSHKVKLRAFEASASAYHRYFVIFIELVGPTFDGPSSSRHMSKLISMYGKTTVVNLLGSKEGERALADAYRVNDSLVLHNFSIRIHYCLSFSVFN